jgi:hypothetical protein
MRAEVLLGAATGCLEVPVGQICIIDREFREQTRVHTFEAGQLLSNSFSIDEHGGIYVATGALAPGQAVQILPDGDMIFTSVTGPVRVALSRLAAPGEALVPGAGSGSSCSRGACASWTKTSDSGPG